MFSAAYCYNEPKIQLKHHHEHHAIYSLPLIGAQNTYIGVRNALYESIQGVDIKIMQKQHRDLLEKESEAPEMLIVLLS